MGYSTDPIGVAPYDGTAATTTSGTSVVGPTATISLAAPAGSVSTSSSVAGTPPPPPPSTP